MAEISQPLMASYEPKQVEQHWYTQWLQSGIFEPNRPSQKPYVVMMPPPNVTGVLHNGHALFVTLQDICVRYHRMLGENALWLPGIDHAGIATQSVVERELKRHEGQSRHDLGRKAFIERVWEWKEKHGSRIVEQLQLLGASADWSRLHFTMDETCSLAVKEAFVRLWNEGLIYRGERLVNWDPATQTALSNEEVDHVTRDGILWKFAYQNADKSQEITVATTRPETMLGDVAIAVHPDDARYQHLVGTYMVHPFFSDRKIIVVADAFVDPEFGTGAVKITPAHDFNDFALGQRHQLPALNIFNFDATVNEQGGSFAGLSRFEARRAVQNALQDAGLYRGEDKIEHAVAVSQRSGEDIEPMLSRQYFIRTKPLAEKAYEAVKQGETRILPKSFEKTWDHFLLNIQDWCISRQLWWGHQIPVFYDTQLLTKHLEDLIKAGVSNQTTQAFLAKKPIKEVLGLALRELDDTAILSISKASTEDLGESHPHLMQEEDVLDTWFSSGLWPFSTLGWPHQTEDLKAFYPGALLETGSDILFFWVARMMMLGIHFMGKAPFADIFLHSMVRDAHGRKMSKSLGNAIDPIDVMNGISLDDLLAKTKTYPVPEKNLSQVLAGIQADYKEGIPPSGADGLRLSLAMLSGQGRDVKLSIPRVAGYRAFLNKVWNATRFALMRVGENPVLPLEQVRPDLSLADRWILSRLSGVIEQVNAAIVDYRFEEAADSIYQFFWTEFCDWYIELAKFALAEHANPKEREATRTVLLEVLDTSMRLMHPICPFITEEIWQKLPTTTTRWKSAGVDFCAIAPYPKADKSWHDTQAETDVGLLQTTIALARNARQESGLPVQKKLPGVIRAESQATLDVLSKYAEAITRLAGFTTLQLGLRADLEVPPGSLINTSAFIDVALQQANEVDVVAEKARLEKELEKVLATLNPLQERLANQRFIEKAPLAVVEQYRQQESELTQKAAKLQEALARLK